jgi:hypothetical protein
MSNSIITPSMIAKEALMQLKNNLVMGSLVYRGYEPEFANQPNGYKVGQTVKIRKPVKYSVRSGATMSVQDTTMGETSITVDQLKGVDLQFSVQELTLSISKFSELHLAPAMTKLAQDVDQALMGLYSSVSSWVGTPGQTIDSYGDFLKGTTRLNDLAVPMSQRMGVLTPNDRAGLLGSFPSLFVERVGEAALTEGRMPSLDGIDMRMSQTIKRHTVGAYGGTPVTSSAATSYDATRVNYYQDITISGASNSITNWARAGDVITLGSVNAVNPETGEDLGYLREFVVVNDANSDGGGAVTLRITPPIITSGPYKTCTAAPSSSTVAQKGTASTTYPQNMLFHKNAFALAVVPLEPLQGIQGVEQVSADGISITLTPAADPVNYVQRWRLDVLYGVKAVYPELATRLSGT